METVVLRTAPTSVISNPNNGKTRATMTVLTSNSVLKRMHMNLLLLYRGKRLSIACAIGVAISAYLAIGPTKVVYIAIFEPTSLVGRFNVT